MSGAHEHGIIGHGPIHRLDPRAKLLGFVGITVLAVSTTAWPVHVACGAALLVIAALAHTPVHTLARRMRIVIPALLLVAFFIPFRGTEVFLTVGAKALIGTFSAVLLAATTPFPDVLHALERLRAPKLLVLIAAFMYRYLFVIVDEVHRMRAALASRGYAPRNALQIGALGRVATALFLRTYERAERVHLAMLARGFDQNMPRMDVLTFRRADVLFLSVLAILVPLRVIA